MALREELAKLRGKLVAERDAHGKTERTLDEARRNPLMRWQANAENAAREAHRPLRTRPRPRRQALR